MASATTLAIVKTSYLPNGSKITTCIPCRNPQSASPTGHPGCPRTLSATPSLVRSVLVVVWAGVDGTYIKVIAAASGRSGEPGTSVPTECGRMGANSYTSGPTGDPV